MRSRSRYLGAQLIDELAGVVFTFFFFSFRKKPLWVLGRPCQLTFRLVWPRRHSGPPPPAGFVAPPLGRFNSSAMILTREGLK